MDLRAIDAVLTQMESWKTTSSNVEQIQLGIEWLDKVGESHAGFRRPSLNSHCTIFQTIATIDVDVKQRARLCYRFQAVCRRTGQLPASCFLSGEVEFKEIVSELPRSTVRRARYQGRDVALKVLRRTASDDPQPISKVSFVTSVVN
jgi:hypothetical protein